MPPSPSASSELTLIKKVRRTVLEALTQEGLIPPESSVLVGVSGGGDSVALLYLLHELRPILGTDLAVAHLDHGLRPGDSDKEADFVSALARDLGLPCHIRRADAAREAKALGLSIEDAGRRCRYRFFKDLCRIAGYDRIALGHHSDDNAELVLLNMLRGSGPQGLAGMAPQRSGGIVRPLLGLRRADLAAYLKSLGAAHLTDPTNRDLGYRRNRIRHELLPHLAHTYNPNITEGLNRLAGILRDETDWIASLAESMLAAATVGQGPESIGLDVPCLNQHHVAARRRIIRCALSRIKGDLKRMGNVHIQSVIDLMGSRNGYGRLDLPDRIRVQRQGRRLTITRVPGPLRETPPPPLHPDSPAAAFRRRVPPLPAPGAPPLRVDLAPRAGEISFSVPSSEKTLEIHKAGQTIAFFDMTTLSFPLIVRNWRPGDRFVPLGMKEWVGINRFLTNQRVPRQERPCALVLESGDRVIWVICHRIDDAVKVRPSTRQVLKAEFKLA